MKATPGTGLRCASWIHRYYCPTGARSLVSQDAEKLAPAGVVDGLGQHAGSQAIDVEVLNSDQSELAYQRARSLVVEVAPLVGYVRVQTGNHLSRLLPAPRSSLVAG